ncbi:hypothetical protein FISHEDRAFT_53453 [Fistulina hepatica ATCC 64428]|nr:hypothetical protein FISHEDRAFT_53453 [Fistulina hepatica ATCC 64428]
MTAYLVIHMLSDNSRRYTYILWFCVLSVFFMFTILHVTGWSSGTTVRAYWNRWALRRRTWRGKHIVRLARKRGIKIYPSSLPPNGQILTLTAIFLVTVLLSFAGPDYIKPSASLFARSYSVSDFINYQPSYTIYKAWWTSGGRTGLIAFALLPLCILLAVKLPPFAVFALPFTLQLHFDKLSWLHRGTGIIIYLLTFLHVVLWSVQLFRDRRASTGKNAYTYAFLYEKFIFGWLAFGCMTLLMLASLPFIRRHHYESFYFLHILFIPLTLLLSALHHPPVAYWCYVALAIWIGERLCRGVQFIYSNGLFGVPEKQAVVQPPHPISVFSPPRSALSERSCYLLTAIDYCPPPGFCRAELIAGATVRLTFIPPTDVTWAPGQHFLINIPAVGRFVTHPFTTASICDMQGTTASSRAIVFLVRVKEGWTRDLWDHVQNIAYSWCMADGPFGSVARVDWCAHSTVVIVVGGAGVSFGMSILEYICLCLAGRDGKALGGRPGCWGRAGFATRRVRFVWVIREFSHLQWCASILRRCASMIAPPGLGVDIFVTNAMSQRPHRLKSLELRSPRNEKSLAPPRSRFTDSRSPSPGPTDSDEEPVSYLDTSAYTSVYGDEDVSPVRSGNLEAQEDYTRDLADFDGDAVMILPGEAQLSQRVRKTGTLRRAKSRKLSMQRRHVPYTQEQDLAMHQHNDSASSDRSTANLLSQRQEREEEYLSRFSIEPSPPIRAPHPSAASFMTDADLEVLRPPSPLGDVYAERSESPPGYDTRLHMSRRELRDVSIVSEFARAGKPRLDLILRDEVQMATGSIIVACCGPTSLNALVRKHVALQIDPSRLRRGDRRGQIELVSEDFGY